MSAGNNASARAADPSRSSVTRPARASRQNENPPRYTEPSAVMSQTSSASAEVRSAPSAPSRQCGRQIHETYPEPIVHAERHLAGTRQEKEERVIASN